MTKRTKDRISRRRTLKILSATGVAGLAGCSGDGTNTGQTDPGSDNTNTGSNGSTDDGDSGLPSKSAGVEAWGQRINEHAQEAGIDWRQQEGSALTFGMNVHTYTQVIEPLLPYFEDLTGINVQFQTFPEDQLWQKLTLDLNNETGVFDGFFLGLWPSARYHNAGWVANYNQFIDDASLTDQDWFAQEDFPESAIDAFTYQGDLVALPFGTEAYGCIAYDRPTFETLGLEEPTNYEELINAAKTIHESDEVDRAGIGSRASATTLSSANWATIFKSYDADWLDYENKEATLDSDAGIASLETFKTLVGDYGPSDIGTYDWYKSNQAFGNGNVGMTLHTPSTIGVFPSEQVERTEWIPPLQGPNGTRAASTWQWALGISQFSSNPEAAWLFVQWATSREAMLLTNTRQWQGQPTYGPARSNWLFEQDEFQEKGPKESWRTAHTEGMSMVPSSPPPVPLHTPQNMDMMSEAAIAMNAAVTGTKSPSKALNDAASPITEFAQDIPDAYLQ